MRKATGGIERSSFRALIQLMDTMKYYYSVGKTQLDLAVDMKKD